MKKVLLGLIFGLTIVSCGGDKKSIDKTDLVEKRIIQKVEIDGMGMLENVTVEKVDKINDSTFNGLYSFFNPVFKKDIRITKRFDFTADLDSIKDTETIKTEMKSEGEWIEKN